MFNVETETHFFKDGINIKNLQDFYRGLAQNCVTVGVHDDKPEMVKKTALWNEFGTKHITGKTYRFQKDGQWYIIPKGTDISIPARPFIRMFLYLYSDGYKEQFAEVIKSSFRVAYKEKLKRGSIDALNVYAVVGEKGKSLMKSKVLKGSFDRSQNQTKPRKKQDDNAPLTVQIKGFNHPLIEDGTLYNSIDYKVEKRGV